VSNAKVRDSIIYIAHPVSLGFITQDREMAIFLAGPLFRKSGRGIVSPIRVEHRTRYRESHQSGTEILVSAHEFLLLPCLVLLHVKTKLLLSVESNHYSRSSSPEFRGMINPGYGAILASQQWNLCVNVGLSRPSGGSFSCQ
jgi:hypothetical protein